MRLLTMDEVSQILNYSKSKLYKLTMQNKIEHVKLFNGGIRFNQDTIYNMIEKNTIKPKVY